LDVLANYYWHLYLLAGIDPPKIRRKAKISLNGWDKLTKLTAQPPTGHQK